MYTRWQSRSLHSYAPEMSWWLRHRQRPHPVEWPWRFVWVLDEETCRVIHLVRVARCSVSFDEPGLTSLSGSDRWLFGRVHPDDVEEYAKDMIDF